MAAKRGLGRNLSALLGPTSPALLDEKPVTGALTLATHCLQPGQYQPRAEMNEALLGQLAASIQQQGLLQPLIVREIAKDRYEIIAGERRWRASQLAGLTEVPVILRQVDDETAMVLALIENLQREDLNALDQARAMHRLTDEFELTHQQVADLLGKSRATVSNALRLLNLNDEVKQRLEEGSLDMGHARALLLLEGEKQQELARLVVSQNLSVRETEKRVAATRNNKMQRSNKPDLTPDIQERLQDLAKLLNTKVNIKFDKNGSGSLLIHYDTLQGLQIVMEQLLL